jgi:hypothetical protein
MIEKSGCKHIQKLRLQREIVKKVFSKKVFSLNHPFSKNFVPETFLSHPRSQSRHPLREMASSNCFHIKLEGKETKKAFSAILKNNPQM